MSVQAKEKSRCEDVTYTHSSYTVYGTIVQYIFFQITVLSKFHWNRYVVCRLCCQSRQYIKRILALEFFGTHSSTRTLIVGIPLRPSRLESKNFCSFPSYFFLLFHPAIVIVTHQMKRVEGGLLCCWRREGRE